jgi:hypothetical protein
MRSRWSVVGGVRWSRGLSTRDIYTLFAEGEGNGLLSRSPVSEITERR